MNKPKPYEQVRVVGLMKLYGEGDRFTAYAWYVKEVTKGEFKGMALVRIGSVELHVPFSKIERMKNNES